jgi:hypothetical protein
MANINLGPIMAQVGSAMETYLPKLSPYANLVIQSQEAYRVEQIPPLIRPDAKRVRITYGPYGVRGQKVFNE